MFVCGRIILSESLSLHVSSHRLRISLLIKFVRKTIKQNTTKKFIRYLCFIAVDFFHSCHHRLKMSSFSMEKNRFDLLAINATTAFTIRISPTFLEILQLFILAEMAKVASLVAGPPKCYINRLERFI